MSRFTPLLLGLIFLGTVASSAQEDYTWWNTTHDWDGVTPWHLYMKVSPSYFGPNALPVPELRSGYLDTSLTLEAGIGVQHAKGDRTIDSRLRLSVPLAKGRVVVEGFVVPLEFYDMDTVTRDLRVARDRDGKGHAGGDICFSTQVSIAKELRYVPAVAFEAAFRTASGTNLGAARFTDAPGYWFSLSAGKDFCRIGKTSLRTYGSLGFYAFQTYDIERLQDDCLLWGAGIDVRNGALTWKNQITGYIGHNHNGDRPAVYRSVITFSRDAVDWLLRFQAGLYDFPYTSVHAGMAYRWGRPQKKTGS